MEEERAPQYSRTFAYVTSSSYRQRVLEALVGSPRRPRDLARSLDLGLPHVSRALSELGKEGLVDRLPSSLPKARLYDLSGEGRILAERIARSKGVLGVIPLARGTHLYYHIQRLYRTYGQEITNEILAKAKIDPEEIDTGLWYSVEMALDLFEAMERLLGDGSYDLVRKAAAEVVVEFASVKEALSRALPFRIVLELAPAVYNKEFNHGRMEVQVEDQRARFLHYDWVSSPGRCKAWQGTYEGILRLRRLRGRVTKFRCRREGDECCAYLVEWE